ncbi:MAG: DUF5009 domain-containing protein [Verrucomicrobiales bacterium]|nr:DUF5009 domain-containing protein [Verrucomicrobiales bacterium]
MSDPPPEETSNRLTSIDTYRGLVMFLMVAEVLHLCHVAEFFPDSKTWALLCHHQQHAPWTGCSLHDLIQPSFSFLVGAVLPFSLARRRSLNQSATRLAVHAFWRALLLVALGIFLRSLNNEQTRFTFEDTLTQIGLGYGFLFLIALAPVAFRWTALVVLLGGYWAAFAYWPLPPEGFDYTAVGVAQDWPHLMSGFEAHWNKNTNIAAAFDVWFLNLFPRETPFVYNGGGYLTLSFIPTLGTMVIGLLAGGILQGDSGSSRKLLSLTAAAAVCLGLGWGLAEAGVCPLVKRIWTPSFALFSGGWCVLALAFFYAVTDVARLKFWAFPLVVIGSNSILIYVMSWTLEGAVTESLKRHLGADVFAVFGERYETLVSGGAVIVVFWLVLFWLYRKRVFLKI